MKTTWNRRILSLTFVLLLLLVQLPSASAAEIPAETSYTNLTAILHNGSPSAVLRHSDGSYLVADQLNKVIWHLAEGAEPVVLVSRIGPADAAFALPWDMTPFLDGYLVSDAENRCLRFFSQGQVLTAVGSGSADDENGVGIKASFNYPTDLATDDTGNVYITDTGNHCCIRSLNPITGEVKIVADATYPKDEIEFYGGDYADGAALSAKFSSPMDISFSADGAMYISDSGNAAIRRLFGGNVTTLLKGEGAESDAYPVDPRGLLTDGKDWLVCDAFAGVVFSPFPAYRDAIPNWAAEAVSYAQGTGLLKGTGDDQFSPNGVMLRRDAVTLLYRMDGLLHLHDEPTSAPPAEIFFGDVPFDSYYFEPIRWAQEQELVFGGEDGLFGADAGISRQDFLMLLCRYAGKNGKDMTVFSNLNTFFDVGQVSDYALSAMQWAIGAGLTKGDGQGHLLPLETLTRAQAAVLLLNYQKLASARCAGSCSLSTSG